MILPLMRIINHDLFYLRRFRPLAEPGDHFPDSILRTVYKRFHRSIVAVLDPSLDTPSLCFQLGVISKEHPLNPAVNVDFDGAQCHSDLLMSKY